MHIENGQTTKLQELFTLQNSLVLYTYQEHDLYVKQVLAFIKESIAANEVILLIENERNYQLIRQQLKKVLTKEEMTLVCYVNSIQFYLSSGSYRPTAIEDYFTSIVLPRFTENRVFRAWAHVEWSTIQGPLYLMREFEERADRSVAEFGFSLLCAYKTEAIPADLLNMLLETHPYVLDDHSLRCSTKYTSTKL